MASRNANERGESEEESLESARSPWAGRTTQNRERARSILHRLTPTAVRGPICLGSLVI